MTYFRFHRSRMIIPGVRVNLSKSGPSLSVGPKGARINVGPQGIRTTLGLPGSGLSAINRVSWNSLMPADTCQKKRTKQTQKAFDNLLDEMTKEEKREFFTRTVQNLPIQAVEAQRNEFETQIAGLTDELSQAEKDDIECIREIYASVITRKASEARSNAKSALALVAMAGVCMWAGIAAGNGWSIAASLLMILVAAGTKSGQRFLEGLMKFLLGILGLTILALVIGFATLLILAFTGNLK